VSDLDEIRDLVHRYADAVCRRDGEQWAGCWTADAVWDVGAGEITGRDAIVDLWTAAMGGFEGVIQTVQDGTASFDGDRGHGCWYVREHYRLTTGEPGMMLGRYDDVYERSGGGWLFAGRTLVPCHQGPSDPSGELRC